MRSNIVKHIFLKEIKEIFRDKKTVFMMIILPILLYPVLMLGLSQVMAMAQQNTAEKVLKVAFDFKTNSVLNTILEKNSKKEEGKLEIVAVENPKVALAEKEIMAYVAIVTDNPKTYAIHRNASIDDSTEAGKRLENIFKEYKQLLIEKNIEKAGLDKKEILEPIIYENVNEARDEQMAGYLLGQVLPMILIIGILVGAIYPAIDVVAGEKERGTLETLLTLPVSNLELIMGKYFAVATVAILSAILNIISIVVSIGFMLLNMSAVMGESLKLDIKFSQMALPFGITLICILLFTMVITAVVMCVCSFARSFKEAQNYSTPVMLVFMIPAYASLIPSLTFNAKTAAIPVVNISLLIKSVLTFQYDIVAMGIVLLSSIAFAALAIIVLTKLFHSEEILFGEGKGFSFLENRANIKANTLPGISDSILLYAIMMLLFVYIGSYVQVKYGIGGIALTQVLFVVVPVLFGIYIKTDFRKLLHLKIPSVRGVIGGIILWMGTFIVVNLLSQLLLYFFPQNMEVLEALSGQMFGESNFLLNLLVIAVLPAICEETFFRGFIFGGLRWNGDAKKTTYKWAIIISGFLFGLMHLYFIKIIPTAVLGMAFAYVMYQTGSILVPMLLHFLNNGLAVVATHYPTSGLEKTLGWLEVDFAKGPTMQIIILVVISTLLILLGVKTLKRRS